MVIVGFQKSTIELYGVNIIIYGGDFCRISPFIRILIGVGREGGLLVDPNLQTAQKIPYPER